MHRALMHSRPSKTAALQHVCWLETSHVPRGSNAILCHHSAGALPAQEEESSKQLDAIMASGSAMGGAGVAAAMEKAGRLKYGSDGTTAMMQCDIALMSAVQNGRPR